MVLKNTSTRTSSRSLLHRKIKKGSNVIKLENLNNFFSIQRYKEAEIGTTKNWALFILEEINNLPEIANSEECIKILLNKLKEHTKGRDFVTMYQYWCKL
jgi:hypothetical protein